MTGKSQPPTYIDSDEALARLAKRLLRQPILAVDTESNPLYAYAERICLVQISTEKRDYLIDPLAGVDLALLGPVFADPGIVKVFHDAEFDLLMLRRVHPFEMSSLFDTRVAGAALGMTRLGLAAMIEEFFEVVLDKRHQRSDWGKRPLSDGQIEYASLDTRYLIGIADELRERLHEAGEPAILEVAAECRRLASIFPPPRRFDPDDFARIKGAEALDPKGRRVLRELFVMRHHIAERRDVPAFKVLANDMLLSIARVRPGDLADLEARAGISPKLVKRHGSMILETTRRAERMGPLERLPRRRTETDDLSSAERETYDELRAWRKRTASARPTDAALVLTRASMLQLASLRPPPRSVDQLAEAGLLEPWRLDLYGEELVGVLQRKGR